jgi:ribonuclease HI
MDDSEKTDSVKGYNALVYTSKYLAVGDQIDINYDYLTGKVVIKDIDDRDKKILRLESEIEALNSQKELYWKWILELITDKENDAMDDIGYCRAKRLELDRYQYKNS